MTDMLQGADAAYAAPILAELEVIRVIAGALDDAEQAGRDDRPGQAHAILAALNRFGYTINEGNSAHG